MTQTKHARPELRPEVTLGHRWEMLGFHGQQLGTVAAVCLDLELGKVNHLLLETQWQRLHIPWHQIYVEDNSGILRFRLRSSPNRKQSSHHPSSE